MSKDQPVVGIIVMHLLRAEPRRLPERVPLGRRRPRVARGHGPAAGRGAAAAPVRGLRGPGGAGRGLRRAPRVQRARPRAARSRGPRAAPRGAPPAALRAAAGRRHAGGGRGPQQPAARAAAVPGGRRARAPAGAVPPAPGARRPEHAVDPGPVTPPLPRSLPDLLCIVSQLESEVNVSLITRTFLFCLHVVLVGQHVALRFRSHHERYGCTT